MIENLLDCLMTVSEFLPVREKLRLAKKKVVFTNGCFDLIHSGHIFLLNQAKQVGDILLVGLNSDKSVREIKGDKRPILSEKERACLLCALKPVDYVIIFEEPTPYQLISYIKPDVLVKGADWGRDEIIGADVVELSGGKVHRIQIQQGKSTTNIIDIIRNRFKEDEKSP